MGLPQSCNGCGIENNSRCGKFTEIHGAGHKEVLILGPWSSSEDASSGVAMSQTSPRGMAFRQYFSSLGVKYEDFLFTNLLHCRPPKEDEKAEWLEEAARNCRPNLQSILTKHRPKVIVTLGSWATRMVLELAGGKKTSVEYLRGYLLPSSLGVPVIPTFDPLFVARGKMALTPLVVRDLHFALDAAKGKFEPVVEPGDIVRYSASSTAGWELLRKLRANPNLILSFDIETDYSEEEAEDELISLNSDEPEEVEEEEENLGRGALDVTRAQIKSMQFSAAPGTGVYLRWPLDRALIEQLLTLPNPKVGHNCWNFDLPIIRSHGIHPTGIIHDTMWMWHHIQPDLPAHLQGVAAQYGMPFPWKHYSSIAPEFYGAADVDAALRIYGGLRLELEAKGVWSSYETYVRKFRGILDRMERRGIPVNPQRLSSFREELDREVEVISNEIQQVTPREVRPVRRVGKPKEVGEWLKLHHLPSLMVEGLPKSKQPKLKDAWENVTRRGDLLDLIRTKLDWEFDPVAGDWFTRLPFNPKSTQQMQEYIKFRGYRMPTRFKDGKATTGMKELEKLGRQTGDRLFGLVMDLRAVAKMGDAYAGKINPATGRPEGGWVPQSDGRLRATFTFGPATWQLAAKSPNVLTTPKRRPGLAKRFRECLEAPPGYRLIEFDFQSFHALTTALEAQDLVLSRLARLDIHSFVAGHLVAYPGMETCLDLPDGDLKKFLKEVRAAHPKVRDYQAKPAVHGTNFGQGYRRLYFEYSEHFASESEARRLLDLLRELFPKLFAWQSEVCLRAATSGYLKSRWGGIRWFWDAMRWQRSDRGKWERVPGRDAEKAKAFLPANDAHGMLRQKLIEMEQLGWDERYGLINAIHDAVLFCCPEEFVEEAIANIRELLTSPVIELADPVMCPDGFVCGVDAAIGRNWAKMEEVASLAPLG